jgi:hypothetical protein
MIVVRVELHSAITGQVTELARMHISNESGGGRLRDYSVASFTGRSTAQLNRQRVQRQARVECWPSAELHVWNLVAVALASMDYGIIRPASVRPDPRVRSG